LNKTVFYRLRTEWFGNIRGDILAGLVVALALIPEAIAFSIIAGVDPKVGLYASFSIAVISAFVGGRPGMISAATAATAVLMVTLVKEHGLQYLLAATVLAGVIQIIAGIARLGYVMRFVSRSVMTGFVNALAILIFMAQLPELVGVRWPTYAMVAAGLAIIYGLPRLTKIVPSPLVCIVVLTAAALTLKLDIRTVGLTVGIDLTSRPDAVGKRGFEAMERAFFDEGMMIRCMGDTLAVASPLIVSEAQIGEIFEKLGRLIRATA